MRSCSCIFAKQGDGEEAVLFEAHHRLPFFWLMLFDKEDVETYRKKMMQLSENDAGQKDTGIGLSKLKAISQAAGRRDYIKQYYATCLPLFDDWLYFLQISDFSDMHIYVDLYEIGSSYNDLNHFCDSMLKAIVCFDENKEAWFEDTVAATCGHEGRNKNKKRFNEMSKACQELNKKNMCGRFDQRLHLKKKRSSGKKRLFYVVVLLGVILLIAGIVWFAVWR